MAPQNVLTFTPVDHPDVQVRALGFDLSDPYLELCWGPMIGPSATLLMRRLPILWAQRIPATITQGELALSLGLGQGTGANSRLTRAMDRTVRFGLARWHVLGCSLDVFYRAPALDRHQLMGLSDWTRLAHDRLLADHLHSVQDRTELGPRVAAMSARLDRVDRPGALSRIAAQRSELR